MKQEIRTAVKAFFEERARMRGGGEKKDNDWTFRLGVKGTAANGEHDVSRFARTSLQDKGGC